MFALDSENSVTKIVIEIRKIRHIYTARQQLHLRVTSGDTWWKSGNGSQA